MGTTLRIAVAAPSRPAAIAAIERAFDAVRGTDGLLSTWRDDSELGRLNHARVGQPVRLSGDLYTLLLESVRWSRALDGAFDPAVGALVDAWNLRGAGRIPSAVELAAAQARTGVAQFRFTDSTRTVTRLSEGAWLDSGGFGKGAALRAAAAALRARGVRSATLDFGGQVVVLGESPAGGDWVVPVAHPARRHDATVRLRLRDRSVSTSGQSERTLEVGGQRVGHVLDPRSGRPAAPWGSVTVVAADPLLADVLSTALFVLGPEAALAWARDRDDVGVLVLEERGAAVVSRWNRALEPLLVRDPPLSRGG